MPNDLATVDLEGVEILKVGGPIFGVGSPPEGDYWTSAQLRDMAAAAAALADEVKPPAKVGHTTDTPAVGWLENFRLNDDESTLLVDIKDVPSTFSDLIKAKAYRTRSVELSTVTSQKTGKVHDWVVTGLAWLGGKMPAVQGLADVPALYEGKAAKVRFVVSYAAGDVIWDPEAGYQDLRDDIAAALNQGGGSDMYVVDVSLDQTRAIVEDWNQDKQWVVPFTLSADGEPQISPSSDWTEAESAWVEAAKAYGASGSRKGRSDTGPTMAETETKLELTDDQRRAFADALEVKPEDLTDTMVLDRLKAKEEPEGDGDGSGDSKPDGDEPATRNLEAATLKRELDAQKTTVVEMQRELHEERRDRFVHEVLSAGKEKPGRKDTVETLYDKDPVFARKFYEGVEPDESLVREYGSDEDGADTSEEKVEADEKAYEAHVRATYGSEFVGAAD